jgi:hypothetical protein
LFGAAARVRAAIGSIVPRRNLDQYERDVAAARAALGEAAFDAAWAAGQALTIDQAVAEALADDTDEHPALRATVGEPYLEDRDDRP